MESLHHIAGLNMTRIDHDAFLGLTLWWDSLFMERVSTVDEFTGEEFDDDDGFRDVALDEEPNPYDSGDVEEDGWRD